MSRNIWLYFLIFLDSILYRANLILDILFFAKFPGARLES
jgi:hypothetical protein